MVDSHLMPTRKSNDLVCLIDSIICLIFIYLLVSMLLKQVLRVLYVTLCIIKAFTVNHGISFLSLKGDGALIKGWCVN